MQRPCSPLPAPSRPRRHHPRRAPRPEPATLLLLGTGSAALQTVCFRAVAARRSHCTRTSRIPRPSRGCDRRSPCTRCGARPYGPCRCSRPTRRPASPATDRTPGPLDADRCLPPRHGLSRGSPVHRCTAAPRVRPRPGR
ncbi:PEP-CTERM sorting domain-containing protein [Streptomyces griseofuscus]|uniref:PEP-CTERM sorting domain-containing protein n=1 Tax=Streptomyces griseofuscus TaxID=146922 RepID=UPI0038044793